jgi:GxxExxY protein
VGTEYTESKERKDKDMSIRTAVSVGEPPCTSYGKYPCSDITEKIIGCAIEVHKTLGPGFKESAYENALLCELTKCGLSYEQQSPVRITYKGTVVGRHRLDLVVEDKIVVELKAVKSLSLEDNKRLLSYLKATGIQIGLLLNFAKPIIEIRRLIL